MQKNKIKFMESNSIKTKLRILLKVMSENGWLLVGQPPFPLFFFSLFFLNNNNLKNNYFSFKNNKGIIGI
jgi:hypothetical protein